MKNTLASLLLLASLATPSFAQDTNKLAQSLGTILGSEEFCSLSYNQDAIAAWIEKNIAADDLRFAPTLNLMVEGTKYNNENKTGSIKTAHCIQISRTAKSMGFIE